MQQKLHLVLREVDHVPAVIYLPPGPPSWHREYLAAGYA